MSEPAMFAPEDVTIIYTDRGELLGYEVQLHTEITARCPAATGLPEASIVCIVSGREHRCMREIEPWHPVHTCHCGLQWSSSKDTANRLTGGDDGQG